MDNQSQFIVLFRKIAVFFCVRHQQEIYATSRFSHRLFDNSSDAWNFIIIDKQPFLSFCRRQCVFGSTAQRWNTKFIICTIITSFDLTHVKQAGSRNFVYSPTFILGCHYQVNAFNLYLFRIYDCLRTCFKGHTSIQHVGKTKHLHINSFRHAGLFILQRINVSSIFVCFFSLLIYSSWHPRHIVHNIRQYLCRLGQVRTSLRLYCINTQAKLTIYFISVRIRIVSKVLAF